MKEEIQKSKFWHNVLCISALTYNLFFISILVIGLFNISIVQNTFQNYAETSSQNAELYFYILTILILNLSSSFGIIKLFSFHKTGFYIYLISTLSLMVFKYYFISINWIEISLLFIYLILFSINRKKYC